VSVKTTGLKHLAQKDNYDDGKAKLFVKFYRFFPKSFFLLEKEKIIISILLYLKGGRT